MNAFLSHFSFEFRTGIRNRNLLLMTYLFPLGVFLMLGLLMTSVNPAFRETLIPASRPWRHRSLSGTPNVPCTRDHYGRQYVCVLSPVFAREVALWLTIPR